MYLETIGGKWAESLSSQGGTADGRRPPKRAELVGNPWRLGDIEGAEDGATRGRGVVDTRRAAEDFWLLRLMMVAGELFWSYMVTWALFVKYECAECEAGLYLYGGHTYQVK